MSTRPIREPEAVLEEILVDAYGEDEQLGALHSALQDNVPVPARATVMGQPVSVLSFDFDGNTRRGLTATLKGRDGARHSMPVSELVFPPDAPGARYVNAYRHWLGLTPHESATASGTLDLSQPVDLVVLAVRETTARCRPLGERTEITLRSGNLWRVVPGEILTLQARKQWRHRGHPYLSGEILSERIDVAALGLAPLRLNEPWPWDPADEYWGEEDTPREDWEEAIIARGPRTSFEMEQVLPGEDPEDEFSDPISEAVELAESGLHQEARRALMDLLLVDLRCLDAHAHLGNLAFDFSVENAARHYEIGVRVGELSLGADFDGVLPWGRIDNRPFLRCMHGYGLCLWRLGREQEAAGLFERMLWLNPADNQGIRFLRQSLRAGETWDDFEKRDA